MFQFRRTMNQWDPKEGPLPQYQTEEFAEIVRKARKILEKRSVSEIRKLQDALDLAIEKTSIDMHSFEPGQEIDFVTLHKTMSIVRNKKYFEPKKSKEKYTWAECYACLALGLTSRVTNSDHSKDFRISFFEIDEETLEKEYESIANNQLVEAVSIIQIADEFFKESNAGKENERLSSIKQIQTEIKRRFKQCINDKPPNNKKIFIWKFYDKLTKKEQNVIGRTRKKDIRRLTKEQKELRRKKAIETFFYNIK